MTLTLLAISFALVIYIIKKTGASPVSVFAGIIFLNQMVFYGVVYMRVYPAINTHSRYVTSDYSGVAHSVIAFYLGIIFLTFLTTKLLPRKVTPRASTDSTGIFTNLHYLNSTTFFSFNLIIFLVYMISASLIDWDAIWHHRIYKAIRDPSEVNLGIFPLSIFHVALPLVGVIYSGLVSYYASTQKYINIMVSIPILLYSHTISLASMSRYAVLQVVIVSVFLYLFSKNRYALVFGLLIGLVEFGIVISARFGGGTEIFRFGDYGLVYVVESIQLFSFFFDDIFLFVLYNMFGGGFVLAEAFSRQSLIYPIQYKILSFSPFPSFIDGFDKWRIFEHRVSLFGPFSNLAEAYHFGIIYFMFYLATILFVNFQATKLLLKSNSPYFHVLLVPLYFAYIKMHAYQIRHTWRWIVLTLIVIALINYAQKRSTR